MTFDFTDNAMRIYPDDDSIETLQWLESKYQSVFEVFRNISGVDVSLIPYRKKLTYGNFSGGLWSVPQSTISVIHLPDLTGGFRITICSDASKEFDNSQILSKHLPNAEKFDSKYKNAITLFLKISSLLKFDIIFCEKRESFTCIAFGVLKDQKNCKVRVEMSMAKHAEPIFRRQQR